METLTPPQKTKKGFKIYNPIVIIQNSTETEILSIELDENFTRIDFIYYAPAHYQNGGWVQISRNTYIRPVGTTQKLNLVTAINIPIAPNKHYFTVPKQMLAYTLYFPALPKNCKAIDIVECDGGFIGNWFNFYGVSMEKVRNETLRVNLIKN